MAELTGKRARFVDEYLIDLNATQAALRAGYSEKTAYSQGQRLLKDVEVQAQLQKRMQDRQQRTEINADYVLKRLVEIDQLDVVDILDNTGNFKPVLDWPKVWRQTLSGMDVQEMMSGDIESVIRKIKWPDKLKNLELLGKHVNVNAFRDQVSVDVNVSLSERMAKARERASKD
ncbi:terminase small subunit [Pseudomonas fluorescens]|uniref:Terminase n=1 Tax=Pseudomonas fluorescens TaxID=294 RepID=A0A0D0PNK0_PSEFL|nr:terminase small subunit [Pseudomonas fluorescens]KIQ60188.1 terminase [Pseudomonas fluorescens]